ncbi:MAG: adenosine-specific kinase [Synergistaceae bacterium]|nr:adenosine-specific kinase [Synergistaceae bacterium]
MSCNISIDIQQVNIPEESNVIIGQSHFIKTVEDIFEALVTSSPSIEFGIAFCEASGDCLIRHDGNNKDLEGAAVENAKAINAGHVFVIVLRKSFPINVLDRIKNVQEVCRVFAATANPLQVLVAETDQGRGVIGVVDGSKTVGIEDENGQSWRKNLLRSIIGYKR